MTKRLLTPQAPPSLAVADGATAPAGGAVGALIWSTTVVGYMYWSGAAWLRLRPYALNSVMTATQIITGITPAVVAGMSYSLPAGGSMDLLAILGGVISATTSGHVIGIQVVNPSGSAGAVSGSFSAEVAVSSAAAATQVFGGGVISVATATTTVFEIAPTTSTSGTNMARFTAMLKNNAAVPVTVSVTSRTTTAAITNTLQIGSSSRALVS